jgi:hypothetical protein
MMNEIALSRRLVNLFASNLLPPFLRSLMPPFHSNAHEAVTLEKRRL